MGCQDGQYKFKIWITIVIFLKLMLCGFQTTLVECWNKLDGNVGELSSWVNTKVTEYRLSSIILNVRM